MKGIAGIQVGVEGRVLELRELVRKGFLDRFGSWQELREKLGACDKQEWA